MNAVYRFGVPAVWCAAAACGQGPVFVGVGDLPGGGFASRALGVSADGSVVVGESVTGSGWRAFRWTRSAGVQALGPLNAGDAFSRADGVSRNGSVVVGASGFAPSVYECTAVFWSGPGAALPLGSFAGGGTPSLAHDVSADGGTIVGEAGANPGGPRAFRAPTSIGATGLGTLPGGDPDYSCANGVSDNGLVIVGRARDASFTTHAMRWTAGLGMVSLGHLNSAGFLDSRAYGCSGDGGIVVGESTSDLGPQEAFVWRAASGMEGLGDLPGGPFRSVALAVAGTGETVVGWSETASGSRAFVWDQSEGMRDLNEVVSTWPGFAGWTLTRATGVSDDGRVIVGVGINPLGQTEGWFADRDGCYPDCNGDAQLTVTDFGCFQTQFVLCCYADCNADGQFTIADFGCFQTKYVLGCP